jgi:Lrp/AsnC family leucine-responsive transcriptional regulator
LAHRIDEIDKKIVQLLSENPELSQVNLAERLKISQPAVSTRMHKLKEMGALAHLVGIEAKKAQLFLAKIDIVTSNTEHVLSFLEKCPLYVNGFVTSGRYNLTVLLMGENMRSIVSCVDSRLRLDPLIKEMGFDLVVTPVRDFVVPVKPILDKKKLTPCEKDCSSCAYYKDSRCLGCPASIHYRGNLL